ncbi:uncharacterized protein [Physcomitrium patens]|uniref:Protein kinase domain-containing protein n=2 Tax=Physcomitrium patens TaxID=3218 RepID=A0A2K1K0E5_PHYPA|nr:probable LIM domain-containing serine/threonine-protein kinase DDB_G0286997 [Physcomitrium patens]XP_024387104.1 probable LIM domain-containing serine/threonine-protein kinase DDB_G0286997 [Physcomitrium patens]XP_024387105.1 probable LIM domain-containing serine/threonine-protein kinase DDB_G0286997 [Physcomitrium patens]XP_024387106.1 probable LIM domain-containing serine/threonine-protein kinase DDB_G0286997 [Physcomitrium patens]XP_024387107.1 probable LIM domain-containing serine/threon|eukprot:XP_024387103.1 probable LIM domain-containing serine/threonine-protein kinase DDB_G0286997 [Physcomitrella patens]
MSVVVDDQGITLLEKKKEEGSVPGSGMAQEHVYGVLARAFEPTTVSHYQTSTQNGFSLPFYSARIQSMIHRRNEFHKEVEFKIEASKDHWSEVEEDVEGEVSNRHVFEYLKKRWGEFFWDYGDSLVFGEKIAEGGQAEIFEAAVVTRQNVCEFKYVAKVMRRSGSLVHLKKQWPEGLLRKIDKGCPFSSDTDSCCLIWGATLLEDGRFAFLMHRYWGDLRTLIDLRMQHNMNQGPPFRDDSAVLIMYQIAVAMEELHDQGILHRDLKASNVLVNVTEDDSYSFDPWHDDGFQCAVADFECSVGVVGTGYWRAPEILEVLKDHGNLHDQQIFTQQVDVYSYAMTCYEILTGCIPFEDRPRTNPEFVLAGERPQLPDHIHPELSKLISRCWSADPSQRPTFTDIVKVITEIDRLLSAYRASPKAFICKDCEDAR